MKEEELMLIERILDGETDLYAVFVTNYNKDIYQLAFQLTKDRELAEDLTQEAFIKGFLKLKSFEKKSRFLTWLYRISYNLIITELRKRKITVFSFDDIAETYEEVAEIDDFFNKEETENRYQKLDDSLQKLTKDEYALIILHYYNQKTIDEMAFITSQTTANVKVKLFRIRKKLYNFMNYE